MSWTEFMCWAAVKITVVFAAAFVLDAGLRRAASAIRYFVWVCAFAAVLTLPILALLVHWDVPVPGRAKAAAARHVDRDRTAQGTIAAAPIEAPDRVSWMLMLWLGGCAAALVRFTAGHARLLQMVRRGREITDPAWRALLADAAREAGLKRPVLLARSGETDTPLSYGSIRPVILLPAGSDEWDSERRKVVLVHELIHARRFDTLAGTAAAVACAVSWFHPLAWIALNRFRREQERSCDDAVIRAGARQSAYAEHLVGLARSLAHPVAWPAAMGIAEASDLETRVRSLLDPGRKRHGLSRGLCLGGLAIAAACVIPLAAVRAQDSKPTTSLAGSVYDPSGAAVPGAIVRLKNADKTNQEQAQADDAGSYRFVRIPSGVYSLEVRARGFAMYQKAGIVLTPNRAQQFDINLDVGQISETVDVVGKGRPPVTPAGAPRRIRVGGNVQATKLIKRVPPVYPQDAQANGIEGTVLLRAVISVDGNLLGLTVINTSVDAVLAKAALDAVEQWRYEPTRLNGVPVEVVTTIAVNFRLGRES